MSSKAVPRVAFTALQDLAVGGTPIPVADIRLEAGGFAHRSPRAQGWGFPFAATDAGG